MVMPEETVHTGANLPHPDAHPEVMSTPAGWYIGYREADGCPYSRESEYYPSEQSARCALELNNWVPRGWPG